MKRNKIFFDKFNEDSANYLFELINKLLVNKKNINIAISGGSTPLPVFRILRNKKIDFKKINFFLVDERFVDDKTNQSNFFNIYNVFFKHIDSRFFKIYYENKSVDELASNYENLIITTIKHNNKGPFFDLILLGMGNDGHTASLFPDSNGLNEKNKLVTSNYVQEIKKYRITMTYPLLLNSLNTIILINDLNKNILLNNLKQSHPIKKIIDNSVNLKILCSNI